MDEKKEEQLSNVERLQKQREGKSALAVEQLEKERAGRNDYFKSGAGFEREEYADKMKERDAVRDAQMKEKEKIYEEQKEEKLKEKDSQERQPKRNNPDTSKSKNTGKGNPTFRSGSSGRGGGSPITKEPDEMLHEKQDAIDPEDTLSKNQGKKQQKQETQQQQAQHKPVIKEAETTQNLSVRERVDRAKEAKEQQVPKFEKSDEVGKDIKEIGIRERIAKAVIEKDKAQAKTPSLKEKSMDVAMKKVEPPSSKSIKR